MKLIQPPGMPPHPWSEGLWIFPEDHPLAPLERAAYAGAKKIPKELEKPPLELEAGDDSEV